MANRVLVPPTLSQVKLQRSKSEIYDTDHEIFSHPLDALRYLLVNLPRELAVPRSMATSRAPKPVRKSKRPMNGVRSP
jgi:hypothetical protein